MLSIRCNQSMPPLPPGLGEWATPGLVLGLFGLIWGEVKASEGRLRADLKASEARQVKRSEEIEARQEKRNDELLAEIKELRDLIVKSLLTAKQP